MKFTCPRCYKDFPRKGELKRHIYNKITCLVGKKGFDIDLKKNENIILGNIDPMNYLKLSNDIIKLKEEMLILKNQNEKLQEENTKISYINNGDGTINNNCNNTYNIVINNYTEPNTDYILSKHCDAALRNGNLTDGCLQMARLIWFNTNHPENHCMYMSNKKDKSIKCLENGTENEYTFDYKFKAIMDVILEVFERAEKESEKAYDLNDIFDNPDKPEYQTIYREIENSLSKELYNKRDLVKETIKQFRQHKMKIKI